MGNCLVSSARVDTALSSFASGTPGCGERTIESDGGKDKPKHVHPQKSEHEILSSPNAKCFSLSELRTATRNFRRDGLLGEGGFGYVFKGWIDDATLAATKPGSGMAIAVKKLKPQGFQGHKEWLTEVYYLGQFHHPNLVKLIGYCSDGDHRLLVYEFMPKGSLENHLFRKMLSKEDVRKRLAMMKKGAEAVPSDKKRRRSQAPSVDTSLEAGGPSLAPSVSTQTPRLVPSAIFPSPPSIPVELRAGKPFVPDFGLTEDDSALASAEFAERIMKNSIPPADLNFLLKMDSSHLSAYYFRMQQAANSFGTLAALRGEEKTKECDELNLKLQKLNLSYTRLSSYSEEKERQCVTAEEKVRRLEAEADMTIARYKSSEAFEAEVRKRIEAFKLSEEYKEGVLDEAARFFSDGFEDLREQVSAAFPEIDFSAFAPKSADASDGEDTTAETTDPAPIAEAQGPVVTEGTPDPTP